MNRILFLALVASAAAAGNFSARMGLVDPPVDLQPSTPGTMQTGNANISGTLLAGKVSASNAGPTAQVIVGNATSTTGANYAGLFRTDSSTGTGLRGVASSASGSGIGGAFQSASERGAGVRGFATALAGENYGVYGQAASPEGWAGYFKGRFRANGDSILSGFLQVAGYTTIGPRLTPPPGSINELLGLSTASNSWGGMYITTGTGGKPYYAYDNGTHRTYHNIDSAGNWSLYNGQFLTFSRQGNLMVDAIGAADALSFRQLGTGRAAYFETTNTGSTAIAAYVKNSGIGGGIQVVLPNASNGARGIDISQSGVGPGIFATSTGGNAVWGITSSISAAGVIGDNTFGEGVVGRVNSNILGVGAVVGRNDGPQGYGVRGFVTDDNAFGVLGQVGVSGGLNGFGVRGDVVNVNGTGIGVYGNASGAAQYAMWANGRSVTTGTKSFVIDHPADPANKMLVHYCTEGSQPMNAYSGNVTTDGEGNAWVNMPSYIEDINKDFRYQLTVIGTFAQAIVGDEIRAGRFQIRTDKPNVKVSWRVEGVRNDRWVKKYGAPDEMDKPANWKGKYIQPDLFDMAPEKGMFYHKPAAGMSDRGVGAAEKNAGAGKRTASSKTGNKGKAQR